MKENNIAESLSPYAHMHKVSEIVANIGLLMVAVGLVVPFINMESGWLLVLIKWIFAAGALLFTIARVAGVFGRKESFKVSRARRMEIWSGICFCVAACFWFYHTWNFDGRVLTFRMLNDTILFTLAGALIQIISSCLVTIRLRGEQKKSESSSDNNN